MELRRLGNSDLELSPVGIGCWAFGGEEKDYWGAQNQKDVDALLKRSIELGLNYFDTAEAYNNGRSEESLGKALSSIPRDKVVIGSKVSARNCYYDTLISSCEASLLRLKTDYLDLYMIHWPFHPISMLRDTNDKALLNKPPQEEEAASALIELQRQGKIRYVGVSNFGVEQLESFKQTGVRIVANQLHYNLLSRAIEFEVLPYCQSQGIGVIGYMPILQGILAGKFDTLEEVPENRRRTRHFSSQSTPLSRHGELGAETEMQEALTEIKELSKKLNIPMAQLATRWAFSKPGVTTSILGARNVAQLQEAAVAAEQLLPERVIEVLDLVTKNLKDKLGLSIDYFEHTDNDRGRYQRTEGSALTANAV